MGPQCGLDQMYRFIYATFYSSQNGPGVAPAGLGVAPAGPSESLRIHCAEHICNSGSSRCSTKENESERQKFHSARECPCRKKVLTVGFSRHWHTLARPPNFFSYTPESRKKVVAGQI